jgi:hypothetical protein
MAEGFGIKSEKKTKDDDYEFPMQIPYIEKMQDKDKYILKELVKSDHKYCWELSPGPSEARTRAREKECRSYDLQPVKW